MKSRSAKSRAIATGCMGVLLLSSSGCGPEEWYTSAKTSDDSSPPDVRLGTLQATRPDGTEIGSWKASPPDADAVPHLGSDAYIYLAAQADDNNGGSKAARIFADLDRVVCEHADGIGTIRQGLHSDRPAAETAESETISDGQSVLKSRVVTYQLHQAIPRRGTTNEYCVETWLVWAEGENFSGTKVKTKTLTFVFDDRPAGQGGPPA